MQATPTSTCQDCKSAQLEPIYCLQLLAQDMSLVHYADTVSKRRVAGAKGLGGNGQNDEESK